jgi:Na+/H+ antiporter NhaA
MLGAAVAALVWANVDVGSYEDFWETTLSIDAGGTTLSLVAALGAIAASVTVYVLANWGASSVEGWGVVLATDTAFALGLLALVGPRSLDRLRAFLLTVVVVDDILALVVIATAYTENTNVVALVVAVGLFGAILAARAPRAPGPRLLRARVATWMALLESGVEPEVLGLAMGLLTSAYPTKRADLERAGDRFASSASN